MFSISQHLTTLLINHNCVIIPDLGGFIAQYVPARFDQEAKKFYPPTRKLAFNADLTMNDGLLVQSLMQTYEATFPEMQKAVEDKVSEIKKALFTKGYYDLQGIGRLSPNLEGHTEFEPATADIVSPSLFALEYVEAKPIAHRQGETNLTHGMIRREGNGYVVRIHRGVANAAAAAVCALFCYFSWNTPAAQDTAIPSQAKLFSTDFFTTSANNEQPEPSATTHFATAATEVAQAHSEAETTTTNNSVEAAENATTPTKPYTIVLAQGLSQTFAEQFATRLAEAGLGEAHAVNEGKYYSLHYAAFDSYGEAQAFLNAHRDNQDFAQGWVREIR